jgi:serine/threonine-protein kinase
LRVEAFKSRQLGQYELVQKLGSGGMGEVWTARHRLLARPAAIKLIRSEMLGNTAQADNLVRRFEREAQATAALTSPHTITVFDFGVTNDRAFYYVMELLEGFDLATLASRWGPLPAGRVIHLVAQACASLSEAHSRGLIHRDIKPSNLFACRIGNQSDFVKVLDFGLVKSADDLPLAGEQLTRLGGVTGTPGFMSPEQISGEQLDGRSDLYALGCVAYTLLTGELVFDGDGGLAVAVQHLKEDPIPPSRRTSLPIPTDLEAIVLSCLAKDRRQRPTDAASLGRSLLQCSAAQEWDEAKAQKWWLDQAGSSDNHSEGRIRTLSRSETLR